MGSERVSMAMTGLLDTNVALYLLGGRLAEPLPSGSYGLSVISEMELLAWPSLTPEEEQKVREFLSQLVICELTLPIPCPRGTTQKRTAFEIARCDHLRHSA